MVLWKAPAFWVLISPKTTITYYITRFLNKNPHIEQMCSTIADAMSCDAQIMLAKREVSDNTYMWDYSVNHPVCNRFNELMDRDAESGLFMTVGSSKKLCVDKKPNFLDGPWKVQFQSLLGEPSPVSTDAAVYMKYDVWTKAKSKS
jgi:hypothetical protein